MYHLKQIAVKSMTIMILSQNDLHSSLEDSFHLSHPQVNPVSLEDFFILKAIDCDCIYSNCFKWMLRYKAFLSFKTFTSMVPLLG